MRPFVLSLCGLLALLAAGGLRADDPLQLRYRMAPEDRLQYRTSSSMTQKQSTGQRSIETRFTQTELELRTLEGIDEEGNFRVKRQNQELSAEVNLGTGQDYRFDSTAAERPQGNALARDLNPFFERLGGASLEFTHSPHGEIVAVQGYRELFGTALEENHLARQFAGGGSDRFFKFGVSELFVVFSDEPVRPGDTWEVDLQADLPPLGKVTGKRVYTYEGPETVGGRATAKITMATRMELNVDSTTDDARVMGKLSVVKSSGTAHFDPEKGQLLSLRSSYTLTGTLSVEANGTTTPISAEQERRVQLDLVQDTPD